MNEIQTIVEATERALKDFEFFCANCFYIIDKNGNVRTLEFNNIQRKIWNVVRAQMRKKKPVRIVILKPRQVGVSTFFCALDVWLMLKRTVKCVLVAHKDDANKEVYGIVRFAVEHLPDWFKRALNVKIDISAEGVAFSHTFSEMNIYTAGGKEIGRAGTKQVLHLTEVAFYPDPEAVTGSLFASFPETPGTFVVQESTGNGVTGYFPDLYNAAKNGKNAYVPLFFPWYEHEEYQMEVPEDAEIIVPDNLRKLYEQGKITKEQLYWRQYTIANKYNGNEDLFRREYPTTEEEAFLQNAPTFFPYTLVSKRIREAENIPYDQGDIAQFGNAPEFVPLVEGDLRIYKYPQAGRRYVIGADASSGVSTSTSDPDQSSADVLDAETGEQVAHISTLIEPVEFGKKLYLLGLYYNTALISVEVNDGHGMTAMNYLRDMGYTMLYMRRVYDQVNKQWISKLGWSTTSKTRPLMLDKLKSAFTTGTIIVNDSRTLSEMLAFVKNEKGKFVAAKGARDDAVLSLSIANIAREEYKSMLMVDSAAANPQAREANPTAGAAAAEQDFFHNVRKKHLYPDMWVHPELGVYY